MLEEIQAIAADTNRSAVMDELATTQRSDDTTAITHSSATLAKRSHHKKALVDEKSLTKPNEQQQTLTELLQELSNLHSSQKELFPSYQDLIRDKSFSTDREHAIQNAYERSVKLAPKNYLISNKLRKTVTSTKFKIAWGLINKGEILDSSMIGLTHSNPNPIHVYEHPVC